MFSEWEFSLKGETLAEFEEAWAKVRYPCTLEGHKGMWAIYDLGKTYPYHDEYYDVIIAYCDWFWYWSDTAPWDMQKGKRSTPKALPKNQALFERPKFDSEAMEKKLKEQGITPIWDSEKL